MINIHEIDEYWWVIMREKILWKFVKTKIMTEKIKKPEISDLFDCAGGWG
jgi:hypothetical protein